MSEQNGEEFKIGCGSCKHAAVMANNVQQYECRRYPPSSFPIPQPGGRVGQFVSFPLVNKDLRCGEYQIKMSRTQ